jgi:hypothetical protein
VGKDTEASTKVSASFALPNTILILTTALIVIERPSLRRNGWHTLGRSWKR